MRSMERVRRKMRDNIEQYGRTVMGIFPNAGDPDPINNTFTYTIGNALKGLPELLVVGGCDTDSARQPFKAMLNQLSQMMIDRGKPFDDGEMVNLGAKFPVWICVADEGVKRRYTIQATSMFRGPPWAIDYEVMQVVFCDKNGLFPWQQGCAEPYSKIKIFRRFDA